MRLPGGGRLPFKELLKRLYQEQDKDGVSDAAAQLSYYLLFALFPFMVFLTTLVAYLPALGSSLSRGISQIQAFLPEDARKLIQERLTGVITTTRPKLLTVGILVTIWSASRGVDALRRALNLAYDVRDARPYWKQQLISIGFTFGGATALLVSVAFLLAGGKLGYWVAERLALDNVYLVVVGILRWPVTIFLLMASIAAGFYLLPDVKQQFRFITPGSVVTTLGWLLTSWGFGFYASRFGSYDVTYGSLGGVMVVLTWLYLSGFVFLIGGELNAVIEHASKSGKKPGEHAEGDGPDRAAVPPKAEGPDPTPPLRPIPDGRPQPRG